MGFSQGGISEEELPRSDCLFNVDLDLYIPPNNNIEVEYPLSIRWH